MTISEIQRTMLNEALPRDRVAQREQAGRALSYVEGWWVIAELNRVFPSGWSYDAGDTREVAREQDDKGRWRVSYSARCVLEAGGVRIVDRGHGHGIDKQAGIAVESAEKEACTDALKRCAKSLGYRLGLALYDKTQEHVADEAAEPQAPAHTASQEARVYDDWSSGVIPADELRKLWPTLSDGLRKRINEEKARRKAAQGAQAQSGGR
jgi:recombination DNA repair RAD52 pathway protein